MGRGGRWAPRRSPASRPLEASDVSNGRFGRSSLSGSPQSRCVVSTRLLVYIWLGYIPRPRRAGIYRSRKGDDDDDDTFLAPVAFTSFTEEYLAGTWGREGSSCQTGGKFHAEWNLRFFLFFEDR